MSLDPKAAYMRAVSSHAKEEYRTEGLSFMTRLNIMAWMQFLALAHVYVYHC